MMDKPVSMSVKNFLIRKLSVEMMIPEKTIEMVVNHQFGRMLDAMSKDESVEMSGFGKFLFNHKKAQRNMEKLLRQKADYERYMQNPELTEKELHDLELRLRSIIRNINSLSKRYEAQS